MLKISTLNVCLAYYTQAQIKRKKYGKSQKDIVELSDYTVDRRDNCQHVSGADSLSGEKCRLSQLLSHKVYLYSGVKSKNVFLWPSKDDIECLISPVVGRRSHISPEDNGSAAPTVYICINWRHIRPLNNMFMVCEHSKQTTGRVITTLWCNCTKFNDIHDDIHDIHSTSWRIIEV